MERLNEKMNETDSLQAPIPMMTEQPSQQHLAAVDLGSNSFHMVVALIEDGHIHILDKLKEMVRLRAGLDKKRRLSGEACMRALACLERFGERVKEFPAGSVAAVGTNTLRQSKNARKFLKQARKALGHPISVIGGGEEARLIYLGVSNSLVDENGMRFVMDIGGGSTELIIGTDAQPLHLRSLNMGCVSISQRYFSDGTLKKKNWQKANTAAHLELRPVRRYFQKAEWNSATGASGTIKTAGKIVTRMGFEPYNITLRSLYQIRDIMIEADSLKNLELPGLKNDRKPVFAGGLAVLIAVFEAIKIDKMQVSDGALREGLLYERIGRLQNEDTRLKTVASVQKRFQISCEHARRVSKTACRLFGYCEKEWGFKPEHAEWLNWAGNLHEIGLAVSLSGYHKHGAYLLDNADLPGFSFENQNRMSVLVRSHRNKISKKYFINFPAEDHLTLLRLSVLLRLAVLLHRSRKDNTAIIDKVTAAEKGLNIQFAKDELKKHPLQHASLRREAKYLEEADFELGYS